MDELREVEIEQISLNPHQPRKAISPEELAELAISIQEVGIIHPPVVRSLENRPNFFELISGERRLRAASFAGLTRIPVVIKNSASDVFSAQSALIENIQRVDLNPLEIAKALQKLIDECGFTQEELAQRIGKKRSTVANYLRLLSLPTSIQEGIASGSISFGHAKAILSSEDQTALHERIIKENLSVREAEKISGEKRRLIRTFDEDANLNALRDQLQQKFGTRVSIKDNGGRGEITIQYFTLEDLDRILDILEIMKD